MMILRIKFITTCKERGISGVGAINQYHEKRVTGWRMTLRNFFIVYQVKGGLLYTKSKVVATKPTATGMQERTSKVASTLLLKKKTLIWNSACSSHLMVHSKSTQIRRLGKWCTASRHPTLRIY